MSIDRGAALRFKKPKRSWPLRLRFRVGYTCAHTGALDFRFRSPVVSESTDRWHLTGGAALRQKNLNDLGLCGRGLAWDTRVPTLVLWIFVFDRRWSLVHRSVALDGGRRAATQKPKRSLASAVEVSRGVHAWPHLSSGFPFSITGAHWSTDRWPWMEGAALRLKNLNDLWPLRSRSRVEYTRGHT